jgi:predicted MFS family arabinose efflux permease
MDPQLKKLLANRDFLKLWISQIASQVTICMVNFTLIERIFEATGSSIAVSFLWITYGLPALLIGPIVGPLIDVTSKRRIMIATNVLQGLTIFSYQFIRGKIFPLYSIVFLYSFLDQFYMPSEAVSIPRIVPRSELPLANGLYSLTFQASLLAGFALAGPLIAFLGADSPFYLGAGLLFLAAIAVSYLPKYEEEHRHPSFAQYWKDLTYGYEYVRNHPLIYIPILMVTSFQIGIAVIAAVFPSYVRDVLGLAVRDASWELVIPGGVGVILASVVFVPRLLRRVRKIQVMKTGLIVAAISLLMFGFIIPLTPQWIRPVLAPLAAITGGVAGIFLLVPANTLIQEHTPNFLRGRVYGSLTFLLTIAMVAPTLVAATITDVIGSSSIIILLGLASLVGFFVSRAKSAEILATLPVGSVKGGRL